VFAVVGIIVMFGVAFVDYHRWQQWALPIYIVTLLLFDLHRDQRPQRARRARWIQIVASRFSVRTGEGHGCY